MTSRATTSLNEFQTGAVQRCRESDLHLMVQPLDIASKDMARDVRSRSINRREESISPIELDRPVLHTYDHTYEDHRNHRG